MTGAVVPPSHLAVGLQRLLTGLVLAGYAVAVGGLVVWATALRHGPAPVPRWSVGLALVVVATTLPALYRRAEPAVHALVFGSDDGVGPNLAELGRGLDGDASPAATLEAMAATAAGLLRVPFVEIEIWPAGHPAHADRPAGSGGGAGVGRDDDAGRGADADGRGWAGGATARAGRPVPGAEGMQVPAVHRGRAVGEVRVGGRRAGQGLSAGDHRLAADVAHQVGLVVATARLSEDLQTSRHQLVVAGEEERRRIRRDLHDGLGPTLASLKLQLGALRRTLDPDRTGPGPVAVLDELDAAVAEAAADVRRLVDGLRPPLLDDLGLVEALRHLRFVPPSLQVSVSQAGPVDDLPAAVEVALYRIAVEAVHNTVRHASATSCAIRLARTADQVTLTVTDDGSGQPADVPWGLGQRTMRERADELGGLITVAAGPEGGTCVAATLPAGGPP